MSMTKPTSEQVTFLAAGTGAQQRTALDKMRETVSVKDFGAVGDNVADDTAAIQAAIDYSIANNVGVYVPAGAYKITANLTISAAQRFYMHGDGRSSRIIATSTVTRIFDMAVGIQFPVFRDMYVGATPVFSTTTDGFYGPGCSHMTMDNVFVEGCKIGIYVRNGWCNLFSNVIARYCRTGVDIGDAANQCTFLHCKFWINLYGAIVRQGFKVCMYGCLFEQNAKTGLVIANISGLLVSGCYFEANAAVAAGQHPAGTTPGIPFTTPSTTVLCSIFIPGGGAEWESGTMAIYAPRQGITIESCFVQHGGDEASGHAFIYAVAVDRLRVSECTRKTGTNAPLIKTYGSFQYQNVTNAKLWSNVGFSKTWLIETLVDGLRVQGVVIESDNMASQVNYAETDLSRWSSISGSTGTWERRAVAGPLGIRSPAYAIVEATTTPSRLFGFQLNAADYPNNAGKLFVFRSWLKASDASLIVWVFATAAPSGAAILTTDWTRRAAYFTWPASGTLTFGFYKQGNASELLVANPMLIEAGAYENELERTFAPQSEFFGTAAPSAGEWLRGDRVWNTTPAAGGDPGWVCVTAGTPGTWKAMANVDA